MHAARKPLAQMSDGPTNVHGGPFAPQVAHTSLDLPAIMGGVPAFPPSNPVPQIFPSGYGYIEEYSAVDSILRNESGLEPTRLPSRQRYLSRGITKLQTSYRSMLQRRIAEYLNLDIGTTSVTCVTSGTNALRAALKAVLNKNLSETRNEVLMPAITASSTAEAIMMEGLVPVLVDVDPNSWVLSVEATARAISDKTAAIVTVDWLGAVCDLRPFRKLADEHNVKLISDSAQSFGAIPGKPPAVGLADATIYSTGYPKVFHTGGAGGILICSLSQAEWLEGEPSDILRHEVMPEINAYLGLRAWDELPKHLKVRAEMAEAYRSLLRDVPGITFQHVGPSLGSTNYQLSVTVDAKDFGLDANSLCRALQAENILCNAERMLSLDSIPRLVRRCRVTDHLSASRKLGENSLTFPIFERLTRGMCEKICACIKAIHEHSRNIAVIKNPIAASSLKKEQLNIIDIADKFSNYWIVPIVDERGFISGIDESIPWTVLVQQKHLAEGNISIDQLNRTISSRSEWTEGDTVIGKLIVHAKVGDTGLVLSSRNGRDPRATNNLVHMDESGSSADVNLVLGNHGAAEIHKKCSHDGIDGNGRPWLERQLRFYESSVAVRDTSIFVKPLRHRIAEDSVTIAFPYVPSISLAEMALSGMNADSLLAVLSDLFGEMATHVWHNNAAPGSENYIEEAHFDRIRRRVGIARAAVPELDNVAGYEYITLNGKKMLGFDRVIDALSQHPKIKEIVPRRLGEIHGDLNLHNVLCQVGPDTDRPVVLVDPRGVPLLHKFSKVKAFEPGDYVYDISKVKFSLSGFSDIRKGFYNLRREGKSFELLLTHHPGSDTMRRADRNLFATLSSNERFTNWIRIVEPDGLQSMKLRVLLGEAANFIADAACALGRAREDEILPLFLMGIAKLNDVLNHIKSKDETNIDMSTQSIQIETAAESPNYGISAIQCALLGSSQTRSTWDVLEVPVKSESTYTIHRLLSDLKGDCLPEGTDILVSTHAAENIRFPCVLIHPFVGERGQTNAVLSGARRSQAFLRDGGVSQDMIDKLRTITVTSTGASTHSQFVSRSNDRLLSPGPWGISPLKLILLEANQLNFPRPGRWVLGSDSFFVLSRAVQTGGDRLCVLTSRNLATSPRSASELYIDSMQRVDERDFVTSLHTAGSSKSEAPLATTGVMFIPNHIGRLLSEMSEDYTTRSSNLLVDIVLPRFMRRDEWVNYCHSSGFGANSDLAWNNTQQISDLSAQVDLAYGGDQMVIRHFRSDAEYIKLVEGARSDPLLASLACLPSTAKWLRQYPKRRASESQQAVLTSGHRAKL